MATPSKFKRTIEASKACCPTAELKKAIHTLAAFSRRVQAPSLLKRIAQSFLFFFCTPSDPAVSQQDLLNAIEWIHRKRLFIRRLKEGGPLEQQLADSLAKVIETYNAACDKKEKTCSKFRLSGERVSVGCKLPKIDLPAREKAVYYYASSGNALKEIDKKVKCSARNEIALSQQSKELFQMKALSLLERYGIATNAQARAYVKKTPIIATVEKNSSIAILEQTLSLFPGQTAVVIGSCTLDPATRTIRCLLPETFSISLKSIQTGFPHPSQRSGWALANQLLPEYPQRIDLLEKSAVLFQRKRQIMQALLSSAPVIEKGKRLLCLKRAAFLANVDELLSLHSDLSKAMIDGACLDCPLDPLAAATRFYQSLKSHKTPFDSLVEASQTLCDFFLAEPCQELLNALLKKGALDSNKETARFQAAKDLLEHAVASAAKKADWQRKAHPLEQAKWAYIASMGEIIGRSCVPIVLQYLSEDLLFPPPVLSLFACQMQTMAYSHVEDFLNELFDEATPPLGEHPSEQALVLSQLKNSLLADIALFQSGGPFPIADELALYYRKRHESLDICER